MGNPLNRENRSFTHSEADRYRSDSMPRRPHFRKCASQASENTRSRPPAMPCYPEGPGSDPGSAPVFPKMRVAAWKTGPDSRKNPFAYAGAQRKSAHFLKRTLAS
jgi:hypothetical protein